MGVGLRVVCVCTGEVGIEEAAIAENPCPFGSRLLASGM